jgi:ribosomal protein L7/L12
VAKLVEAMPHIAAEVRAMHAAHQPMDAIVAYMREQGLSKFYSIRELRQALDLPLREAKRVVHLSPVWADYRESDDELHRNAEIAARMSDEEAERMLSS